MKKITLIPVIACLALISTFTSCKKDEETTPTPTTTTPTTTSSSTTPSPNVGNVDGALVSLRVGVTSVTAGYPITVNTENALATFFTATGNSSTFADGGVVSVNSISLEKQTNNSYFKTASIGLTPTDLDFDTDNSNWSVAGAGSVPAFTYNHNVDFPDFTGTVPESVTRSAGISIALAGKVSDADSVILFLVKGNTTVIRTFAGNATTATITAADLAAFPVVTDKSAMLEVIPYRVTLNTQGSKTYAFIKEHAIVKNVNID